MGVVILPHPYGQIALTLLSPYGYRCGISTTSIGEHDTPNKGRNPPMFGMVYAYVLGA